MAGSDSNNTPRVIEKVTVVTSNGKADGRHLGVRIKYANQSKEVPFRYAHEVTQDPKKEDTELKPSDDIDDKLNKGSKKPADKLCTENLLKKLSESKQYVFKQTDDNVKYVKYKSITGTVIKIALGSAVGYLFIASAINGIPTVIKGIFGSGQPVPTPNKTEATASLSPEPSKSAPAPSPTQSQAAAVPSPSTQIDIKTGYELRAANLMALFGHNYIGIDDPTRVVKDSQNLFDGLKKTGNTTLTLDDVIEYVIYENTKGKLTEERKTTFDEVLEAIANAKSEDVKDALQKVKYDDTYIDIEALVLATIYNEEAHEYSEVVLVPKGELSKAILAKAPEADVEKLVLKNADILVNGPGDDFGKVKTADGSIIESDSLYPAIQVVTTRLSANTANVLFTRDPERWFTPAELPNSNFIPGTRGIWVKALFDKVNDRYNYYTSQLIGCEDPKEISMQPLSEQEISNVLGGRVL